MILPLSRYAPEGRPTRRLDFPARSGIPTQNLFKGLDATSQQPDPPVPPSILRPSSIHPPINDPQTKRNNRRRKTARSTHKVARRIPLPLLTLNPNPLRNHRRATSPTVIESNRNPQSDNRRHVASHPRAQRARAGESTASTEEEAAVSRGVCIRWEQTGCEPADAADGRDGRDVPAARVEMVGAPADEEADDVAEDPGGYCSRTLARLVPETDSTQLRDQPTSHQLRLNRRKPQPIHNLRRKKRQRPDRYAIQQVRQVMRQHPGAERRL
jgi:hypothetical protein